MTARIASLALLASGLAAASPAAAAPRALEPCETLAAQARAHSTHGATVRDFTLSRDRTIAPLLSPAKRSPPSPKLVSELARLVPEWADESFKEVQQIDRTTWRAVVTQGTMRCEDEVFFRVASGGGLLRLVTPPAYSELCWTSGRDFGAVNGQPALIETEVLDRPTLGTDVEITPWADGWRESCRLSLRYDDSFRLAETFCRDPGVCKAGAVLAPKLARAFSHNLKSDAALHAVSPPSGAAVKAWGDMETLISKLPRDEQSIRPVLASFGAKPKTEFPDYVDAMTSVPVNAGGRAFLANVGIGGVGWRAMGDYLITLYEWDGAALHPVAGYVVERKVGKLVSATTSAPMPYVDSR
ncbi:MAG TPA: hypothetical protein VGH86_17750 [Phenylobacterium sp.]